MIDKNIPPDDELGYDPDETRNNYNKNDEEGERLEKSINQAHNRQRSILHFFQINPRKTFAVFEIMDLVFFSDVARSSVGSALTNLSDRGHLEMTPIQRMGPWSRKVYTWCLRGTVEWHLVEGEKDLYIKYSDVNKDWVFQKITRAIFKRWSGTKSEAQQRKEDLNNVRK